MSDDLIISGGDSTIVASDAILSRIESLVSLGTVLYSAVSQLGLLEQDSLSLGLRAASTGSDAAAASLRRSRESLVAARHSTVTIAHGSENLGARTRAVLEAYGAVEQQAELIARHEKSSEAWWTGRVLATAAIPLAVGAGLTELLLLTQNRTTPASQVKSAADYLLAHPEVITSRDTVQSVRDATDNVDDFASGTIGLPPELMTLFENASGRTGTTFSAAMIMALANKFGLLGETGVSTRRATVEAGVSAPASLSERFDRIPHANAEPQGQQIRIDRYVTPGKPDRFDVYVGGTADFSPRASAEPFDMTSNIAGVARYSPASYRAVLSAMHQAGVTAKTPVQLTGYSQGGLIAALVASAPRLDVKGLVTFGAPIATVPVPASIPTLTIRNAEDLVPATAGYDIAKHAVVVERAVFDHQPIPTGLAVPAHQPQYYRQTAGLIDAATSDEITTIRRGIDDFGSAAGSVETTTWVAHRTGTR